MAAVHVRNLDSEVVEALKRRASRNDRSLEGELRHILSNAAIEEPATKRRKLDPLKLHFSNAKTTGSWRREEIYGDDGR